MQQQQHRNQLSRALEIVLGQDPGTTSFDKRNLQALSKVFPNRAGNIAAYVQHTRKKTIEHRAMLAGGNAVMRNKLTRAKSTLRTLPFIKYMNSTALVFTKLRNTMQTIGKSLSKQVYNKRLLQKTFRDEVVEAVMKKPWKGGAMLWEPGTDNGSRHILYPENIYSHNLLGYGDGGEYFKIDIKNKGARGMQISTKLLHVPGPLPESSRHLNLYIDWTITVSATVDPHGNVNEQIIHVDAKPSADFNSILQAFVIARGFGPSMIRFDSYRMVQGERNILKAYAHAMST